MKLGAELARMLENLAKLVANLYTLAASQFAAGSSTEDDPKSVDALLSRVITFVREILHILTQGLRET